MIKQLITNILSIEPTVVISTASGIALLAANFGLTTALDIPSAVVTGFNLVWIIGTVIGVRQSVYSPKTHAKDVAQAQAAGVPSIETQVPEEGQG